MIHPSNRTGLHNPSSPCALCGHLAEVGLLCFGHRDELVKMLDPRQLGDTFVKPGERRTPPSIPALYRLLSAQRGVRGPMAVGHDALGPRSPADDDAVVLRDPRSRAEVYGRDDTDRAPDAPLVVLGRLAGRTFIDRGRPEREPEWSVAGLSSYLHGHVDWLAAQAWVVSSFAALRALQASLRRAVDDPPPRPVGRCWVLVDEAGRETPGGAWRCNHLLYMPEPELRGADEPIRALPSIRCSGCHHHYTGAELVQLGRMLEEEAS